MAGSPPGARDGEKTDHTIEDATVPQDGSTETEKRSDGDDSSNTITTAEQTVLSEQLRFDDVKLSFFGIYSFASWIDIIIVIICSVCAVIAGAIIPVTPIISSRIILAFSKAEAQGSDLRPLVDQYTLYYVYIMIAALVTWFVSTAGFNFTGARITRTIKKSYFSAVLRQNMAVFDDKGAGEILSHLTDDTMAIQNAISSKLSQTISAGGTLVGTIAVCFSLDWLLTFELIWSLVLGYAVLYLGGKLTVRYSSRSIEASSAGSAVVEEALSSIKTTTALGMQNHVHSTYMAFLGKASKNGFVLGSMNAGMLAVCVASGYFNVALAFWQGSRRLTDAKTSFTAVVTIAMVTKAAAFCVLSVGSNMEIFAMAVAGTRRLARMTHRVSPIDSSNEKGLSPGQFNSTMELRNVRHIYPCRPNTVVLDDVSLVFPSGRTTAIVGHSGSGKSSISNMLLRFYDPLAGRILLDDKDLSTYQIRWLRQQIAVVKQESFMFNKSVYDNIKIGLTGPRWAAVSDDDKDKAIYKAAEIAQADDFVRKLPQGYETIVGTRGSRLSGGQLQRIAIARALVNDPQILILDEATSALDTTTEAKLLSAMTGENRQRTTIVIAHRLSTIREADNIVVLNAGRVVESGTHDDLMAAQSFYYELVKAQDVGHDEQSTNDDEILDEKRDSTSSSVAKADVDKDQNDGEGQTGASSDAETNDNVVSSSVFSMMVFIFKLNKGEWHWLILGLIFCVIAGGEEPASAVLFGKAISAISQSSGNSADTIRSQAGFYSWMFFLLAWVMLIACAAQGIAFAFSSEHLTTRVRSLALQQYLRMDISYFDKKENSAAALSGFLSGSTRDLTGLSGSALGIILICISTLISGVVVSLALGWKLALVCLSVIPLMMGGGYFGVWLVGDFEKKNELFANRTAEFAGETLHGIQTIAALTREQTALDEFHETLEASKTKALAANLQASLMYALTQTAYYACMALSFWYGGRLILRGEYSLFQVIAVQSAMLLSGYSAGMIFSWTPNIGSAKQAAASLQRLLAQKSAIDPSSPGGAKADAIQGQIEFNSVSFAYPSRPDHPALKNLSFKIPSGANVAFVGTTGSGKSTIVSLIERFYDPTSGSVLVDSKPIDFYKMSEYRKSIALVSQEPNLYSGTIKMNLTLGLEDEDVKPSDAAIEAACKEANIYDFISSLPDGLNTEVGSGGNQLSVGQKQRIVLARALLRQPKILLLDEATSALDSQSESLIQQTLDKVKKNRTTITIAHRLSTIVKADKIYVLSEGNIVESGTHPQLMALKGSYYELYTASKSGQTL
ncbi:multidrug resistance protein [Trichoderma compactum]